MGFVPCDSLQPWGTLAHHMGLNGGIGVVRTGNMEGRGIVFPGQAEPALERGSFSWGVSRVSWSSKHIEKRGRG